MAGKKKQAVNRREDGKFTRGNSIGEETRFQPGQSGNPTGRPRDFETEFREWTGEDGRPFALKKARECAKAGDWRAVQYLLDRFYGKLTEKHEYVVLDIHVQYVALVHKAVTQAADKELADKVIDLLESGEVK